MADILDEVESDYRAEQLRAAAARYSGAAITVVALVLIAVGAWQLWNTRRARNDAAAAASYTDAAKAADSLVAGDIPAHLAMAQRLAALAATAPTGYATLARLREAGLLADAGQLPEAQAVWSAISTDPAVDLPLRQLASLLWVERGLDTSDTAALRTRLVSIVAADNPFHALGVEAQAMLALRLNQPEAARALLRRLAADPSTPDGVRGRAGALLSRLGS